MANPTNKHVIYNVSPADDGLVFAERERALFISRIRDAISNSSTWEEFRQAIPQDEYSKIMRSAFDDNGEPRPKATDKFDAELVPGYSDGDYPPWLQQEMHKVLPKEIMKRYAKREVTILNGTYMHIDPEWLPEIKARLEELGYEVEDGRHLSFF